MILFRERTEQIRIKKDSDILGFTVKIKAVYSAQVDSDSGMSVNLKDVDDWMNEVSANLPVFKNTAEILKFYYEGLGHLSSKLVRVELTRGSAHFEFDGQNMTYVYQVKTWFQENKAWMQRRVKLTAGAPLPKTWRMKLAAKKWSKPEIFGKKLKKKIKTVSAVEVENREWNGWLGF